MVIGEGTLLTIDQLTYETCTHSQLPQCPDTYLAHFPVLHQHSKLLKYWELAFHL